MGSKIVKFCDHCKREFGAGCYPRRVGKLTLCRAKHDIVNHSALDLGEAEVVTHAG